jgi:hypothetical protein
MASVKDDLLDFLCRVPGLADPDSRGMLLSNIPRDLASTVDRHAARMQDLHAIIRHAEQGARLENGTQALEVVLENVRRLVAGLTLEQELDALKLRLRKLLQASLHENLQVAADHSQPRDNRNKAAQQVADKIDPKVPVEFLRQLATSYYQSDDDPTPRFWIAIALGNTGRPEAEEVLKELFSWEQDPYPKVGIQQALQILLSPMQQRKDIQ